MPTPEPPSTPAPRRVNLRTPEVMTRVQAEVESHYRSAIVDRLRANGGTITAGGVTVKLAKQFGFCYGVERAIDLAYAAAKVFPDRRLYILGEIIHNPEVNEQIRSMGIRNLVDGSGQPALDLLCEGDVVIVPAFGTDVATLARIQERGCQIVDTTCGDVMSVWKRVRQNAGSDITSIIHGKAQHEETKATASRAFSGGRGHYLILLTLEETDAVCDYIRNGGDKLAFLRRFRGAHSEGFDPDLHLRRVGVANQTTMLRAETEEVQRRIKAAVVDRDGPERAAESFRFFDTICGATQERQDALTEMLSQPMDLLLVIGGYNSSNTSHLAELGQEILPTYFIGNATRLGSREHIRHFDLQTKAEILTEHWLPCPPVTIGITAGASCPNNLIEEAILRVFALHGVRREALLQA
ncbi:MAG: 4-hydroxy-3-methylbut-2-enyl diphosphate reductase [Verrucomicrobiota bacterium]